MWLVNWIAIRLVVVMNDISEPDAYRLKKTYLDAGGDPDYVIMSSKDLANLIERERVEAKIDEVEKYDKHCAIEMAQLYGDFNKNGSLSVSKAKGYGSPYAHDRLKQLKGQDDITSQ